MKQDGSDITIRMVKEQMAEYCKCNPQNVLCYSSDPTGQYVRKLIKKDTDLHKILFNTRGVELSYQVCYEPVYDDGVFERPALGVAPGKIHVTEWSSEHVIWWFENEIKDLWFAQKLDRDRRNNHNTLTGRQLIHISELTLRDFGFNDPIKRLEVLSKIRELT